MDDKHIEDMLRESWSPQPPGGMRDRVLRSARQELARTRRSNWSLWGIRWKPLLASLAVVVLLVTNILDHRLQSHLNAMMDGASPAGVMSPIDPGCIIKQRKEIANLLAQIPTSGGLEGAVKGADSL